MRQFFIDWARCLGLIIKTAFSIFMKIFKVLTIVFLLFAWNLALPAYILGCLHVDTTLPAAMLYIVPMTMVTLAVTVSGLYAYFGYRHRKCTATCTHCTKNCKCR